MKNGFIKVGAFTKKVKVGEVGFNQKSIVDGVLQASNLGVKLLAFPELALSGATAGDLFTMRNFIEKNKSAIVNIADETKSCDTIFVFGAPFEKDALLYDCAFVVYKGEVLGIVPKMYLANFKENSDSRWFAVPTFEGSFVDLFGKKIPFGSNLIFKNSNFNDFSFTVEVGDVYSSPKNNIIDKAINGATIVVNIGASSEVIGSKDYRRNAIMAESAKNVCGFIRASAGSGESTTDCVYAGHNLIVENGKILVESEIFNNSLITTEIDVDFLQVERAKIFKSVCVEKTNIYTISFDMKISETELSRQYSKTPFVPTDAKTLGERAVDIINMQVEGLKTRISHTNAKSVVIGLSGGLDSTLALLVAHKSMIALGRDVKDIIGVTMPCFGTTSRTLTNTIALAKCLGVTLKKIDISKAVTRHLKDIKHPLDLYDVTFENAQARERTQVIMDIANMTNGFVLGTGDLSELALGWATYNGDHMSMYGVNSSVPKTLVKYLVRHFAINSKPKLKAVLFDILDTPVSPELLPAVDGEISQKTEEIVGPYVLHDFFLHAFVRMGYSPKKIYRIAKYVFETDFSDDVILKWLKTFVRRFFTQQFKRSCVPDGVKIGSVALSPRGDWRMPSDAHAKIWLDELENL